MTKPILISLAPNNFWDDTLLALLNFFCPFFWKKGKAISCLENQFKKLFAVPYIFSFHTGRAALQVGLEALKFPKGSEILLQAFSCVVVSNSVRFAGLKPVFVDVKPHSFSLDPLDLEKKITSKTKAIILQNLFGIPDDITEIQVVAKKHHLKIIEDGAQALGATYKGRKIGQFGEFAFFSFGSDKVISSTNGGMLITKNKNLAKEIKKIYQAINFPDYWWIFKQLFYPLACSLVVLTYFWLPVGKFSLGKVILVGLQKLGLLEKQVKENEKKGKPFKDYYPKKLPNVLAILALHQLKKIDKFNIKRRKIAQYYFRQLKKIKGLQFFNLNKLKKGIYLRFPLKVVHAQELRNFCQKRKIILGTWYDKVIAPRGTSLKKIGYKLGSCPVAEKLIKDIINLPTFPKMSMKDARRVVSCLEEFYENRNRRNQK